MLAGRAGRRPEDALPLQRRAPPSLGGDEAEEAASVDDAVANASEVAAPVAGAAGFDPAIAAEAAAAAGGALLLLMSAGLPAGEADEPWAALAVAVAAAAILLRLFGDEAPCLARQFDLGALINATQLVADVLRTASAAVSSAGKEASGPSAEAAPRASQALPESADGGVEKVERRVSRAVGAEGGGQRTTPWPAALEYGRNTLERFAGGLRRQLEAFGKIPVRGWGVERYGVVVFCESGRREGGGWRVPITARLFKRNERRHHLGLALLRRLILQSMLGFKEVDDDARAIFDERTSLVFRNFEHVGEQKGYVLQARLVGFPSGASVSGEWQDLPAADKDGQAEANMWFSDEDIAKALAAVGQIVLPSGVLPPGGAVHIEVRRRPLTPPMEPGDPTLPPAASVALVPLVAESGLTVVSDIDDTVKVTEVFLGMHQVLLNTFLSPFRPVDGMAELYRGWAQRYGASFEYVSRSPPELREPLRGFLDEAGFPLSSLHLCSLWSPERRNFKQRRINELLEEFPHRRFVLVGDSGERDAAIYAGVARAHPDRVAKVLIRRVTEQSVVDAGVFDGLGADRWQVFRRPSEVELELSEEEEWAPLSARAPS